MKIGIQRIEGYAYGAIQPSIIFRFSDLPSGKNNASKQLAQLCESLPRFDDDNRFAHSGLATSLAEAPATLITILDNLNHYSGDSRFTPIQVFEEGKSLCFAIPTLSPTMTNFNFKSITHFLSMMGKGLQGDEISSLLAENKAKVRAFLPRGTNAIGLILAASKHKIPFKIFNQNYIIFGYGTGSSIFNSSLTDQESVIGVRLAKSKVDTNRLLKVSGFPVAEQARVRNIEDALQFAEKIGFPLVLKPELEEQGRGVFANITNEVELKECFEQASESYSDLILERFVKGFSYRVQIHDGTVIEAWQMNPPYLIGDGTLSIGELIDIENAKPDRNAINGSMKPIPLDDVTLKNLKKLDLTLKCVPRAGDKITLAETSNESRGGTSENFLNFLHPENAELCADAAKTLGLKVAGVDLISEDGSKQWRGNNTVICEINSQPELGDFTSYPHLYHDLLEKIPRSHVIIELKISNKYAKINLNIFNKAKSKIVIKCTPSHLLNHGCPTQYFDEMLFENDVSVEEQKKINAIISSVPSNRP
tara:strand:- start:1914 stop:3518 length:1605 start_codon:yes stop_codon:yes gene_type:complete